jgi:hypothetical protein
MKKEKYPIDIVIPWVDGSDEKWRMEKEKYSLDRQQASSVHSFDYKDWGLLKYLFRGIEKYASWVNKVYFITWGHLPDWLNINYDKLVVVRHEDYIPKDYLPTFSSHTIELNIHRIRGLSEHFIYFNDDMYLISDTKPDFFFKNGLPCDSAVINPIAPKGRNVISNLQLTNIAIINEHFDKRRVIRENPLKWFNIKYAQLLPLNIIFLPWERFPGLLEKHVSTSFLKSSYIEVWDKEYELLNETCMHKFRNFKTDVNQWLIKEWQIAKGIFIPRYINSSKLYTIYNIEDAMAVCNALIMKKYKMICINDHLESDNTDEIMAIIKNGFENVFPEKSRYEL